jgi:uncharacterized membrane protein YeiB
MPTGTPVRPSATPALSSEHVLAPDLARCGMLLIALANAADAVNANGPGVDTTPVVLPRVDTVVLFSLVHSSAEPMFAILVGCGLVQLAHRQQSAPGSPHAVQRLLVRNAWLGSAIACLMHGRGYRGPAGGLLHRLTYGRR